MAYELTDLLLPKSGHLRSEAGKALYEAEKAAFFAGLRAVAATLDFRPSSRGWGYLLETAGVITKGQFDLVERLITEGRKSGALPLDICSEDTAREFDGVEELDERTPAEEADSLVEIVENWHKEYTPISFWDDQRYYLQLVVEKIDLKSLFSGICVAYRIPHANAHGWGDLHIRANMMGRFKHWEGKGKQTVLLYCGDLDAVGLKISDVLRDNMAELSGQVGWSPDHVIIDRFGLNAGFVESHGLTWIDNLITGSGKDLAKDSHPQHHYPYVQDYLQRYCEQNPDGTWRGRKVEANALVAHPEAGRALLRQAIRRYVPDNAPERYERRLAPHRERMRQEGIRKVRAWLAAQR
jgi:hypothetical protein